MVKEVLNDTKYEINYINEFKDGVIITTKSVTDEQISELENKLKAKYSSFNYEENDNERIIISIDMPKVKIFDLIKVYIKPIIITTIISIIFLAIVFRKLGIVKSVFLPLGLIFLINAVYISAIAIIRIPVSEYIISIGLFVYAISILTTTIYLKTKREKQGA